MKNRWTDHFPEYLIEAWALGTFMLSACLVTALLEHPASPVRQAISSAFVRRGLIGFAMGLTAVGLIYSPWGKRSGAHMNPSVTFAFWRLGKIRSKDVFYYTLFQCVGGILGVLLSVVLLGRAIQDPSVAYAVTLPGPGGVAEAFWAEFVISFLLMGVVLMASHTPALEPWTGLLAGTLVAFYILLEAPFSGMSMNPARTLASAIPSGIYRHLWIYMTAPPLGMLAAAEVFRQTTAGASVGCAKMIHDSAQPCMFCGHQP